MDFDLVVTDLDGTLWSGDEVLHPAAHAAVHALAGRGLPLLIATGRRRRGAESGLFRAGLQPPAVLLGGCLGVDLATGTTFHRLGYAADVAEAVLDTFLAHGIEPCVYVEHPDTEAFVGADPATHPLHRQRLAPFVDDLRRVVREERVVHFSVVGCDASGLAGLAAALRAAAVPILTDDGTFGGATLMVGPPGVSKWDGIVAFCAERGLDPARALVVGDGPNDLEMLAAAAVACVVEDGCAEALAFADHVIPSARVGGFAAVLDLV